MKTPRRADRRQQRIDARRESRRAAVANQGLPGDALAGTQLLQFSWHAAEPPAVAARRLDLGAWVAAERPCCPRCTREGHREILVVGADAAGHVSVIACHVHGHFLPLNRVWPLAVYGKPEQVAAERAALESMTRHWRDAERKVRASDQQFFHDHPTRQWRARSAFTPWECHGEAKVSGQRYAIVQRGAPEYQRALVVTADPGFDLSSPPAEFPDSMIDAYCREFAAHPEGSDHVSLTLADLGGDAA